MGLVAVAIKLQPVPAPLGQPPRVCGSASAPSPPSDAEPAPQYGISLDTQRYPDATISLAQPVTPASGTTLTVNAAGTLTLHGVTRTVTVPALRPPGRHEHRHRRLGPGRLRRLRNHRTHGYGGLGSLADHGVAEFLLVLHRS